MDMPEILRRFEHLVVKSLMLMMAIVVFLATVELAYILVKDIISPPMFLLNIDELQEIFGMFMLVLIGLELFESIQIYHQQRVVRVEIVILVAIIAVARKVIILDYKSLSTLTLLEFGVGILCLALTYLLLRTRRLPFMEPRREKSAGLPAPDKRTDA